MKLKKANVPATPAASVDQRLAQTVVLLQRQFLLTEHAIQAGTASLMEFEGAIGSGYQSIRNVFSVFNYAFSLVDHLVRYRKIASVLPRINQKGAEFRAVESALQPLTQVRNQFQHINNLIENQNSGPLLGSVCWHSSTSQFVASFNDIGRQRSVPLVWLDTLTGKFGLHFCYIYNESYYDLDKAIKGMRDFQQFINGYCAVQIDGKEFVQEEHFTAMKIDFKLSANAV